MVPKNIKEFIKKIPLVVSSYKLYISLLLLLNKIINKIRFLSYGDIVIKKVHKSLESSGLIFFIDMGTLLGIYRNGRLIKRDMDIDIGIQINSELDIQLVRSIFISKGFKHKYIFRTSDLGIIQDTFIYKGVTIDFSYYQYDGTYDYCYMLYDTDEFKNLIIRMNCRHVEGIKQFRYKHLFVNIPENTEDYLYDRYGKNWRIPDSNYKYWEGPSVVKIIGTGTCESLI